MNPYQTIGRPENAHPWASWRADFSTLGQKDPGRRPANNVELGLWESWKLTFKNLEPLILKQKIICEIAARAQSLMDSQRYTAFLWTPADQQSIDTQLARINALSRAMVGVESGKYFIRLRDGDLDLLADPAMPREQWQADVYADLGVAPIIWVLAVGGLIVGSIFAASAVLKSFAEKQSAEIERRLIEIDREMARAPESQRAAWQQFKKENRPPAQEAGVLAKIFGGDFMGKMGFGIAIGLIAYFVIRAFSKEKKTNDAT